jgi:hypothetical protein
MNLFSFIVFLKTLVYKVFSYRVSSSVRFSGLFRGLILHEEAPQNRARVFKGLLHIKKKNRETEEIILKPGRTKKLPLCIFQAYLTELISLRKVQP